MAFQKEYLDLFLVPLGLVIMFAYHLLLLSRCLNYPQTTVIGSQNEERKTWVKQIMGDNSKYASVAVTVISSNISAATYLASVSLTLSALIGAWLGSSYNDVFQSDIIYGDTRPSTITIKYISLLTCFLLAFYCFVQSSGFLVQANYLISIPDGNLTAEDVESALIKGSDFWSLGLRALFLAVTLLPWFFGPIPMFIMSILMILILHNLDRNPTNPRRSKSSGNGSVKKPLVSEIQ